MTCPCGRSAWQRIHKSGLSQCIGCDELVLITGAIVIQNRHGDKWDFRHEDVGELIT